MTSVIPGKFLLLYPGDKHVLPVLSTIFRPDGYASTMRKKFISLLLLTGTISQIVAQDCDCSISNSFRRQQRASENFIVSSALDALKNITSPGCVIKYYEWLAESYNAKSQYDSSFLALSKSLELLKGKSCTEKNYENYYRQLATVSHNSGDYSKALEFSLRLLPLTEISGDRFEETSCLLMIAHTFNRMKESGKGIEYARKAYIRSKEVNQPLEKAYLLSRLSSAYLWRYQDSKDKLLLDSVEILAREQITICKRNGFNKLLRKGYNMMNGYAHERGDYDKALLYIDSSLYLAEVTGDITQKATNYGDKADVMMELGNYKEARRFADSSLALHKLSKNPETIANAYALIYQLSTRSENYKDALDAMNSYLEIQDSLTNAEKSKTINELEQKYNKAKNEKTIKELAQQKRIYILLAAAGLFALVGLVFFIRQQSLKNKQKILETEQRLNRARMNPHFFFNALSSLQSYALEGNDGKSIASNLSKFSHIMRETLESTYKEYVTVEQEAEFLREYLELQKVRFPEKFSYNINISRSVEADETLIPSMILQPSVENSIEHGFKGIEHPGLVTILFDVNEKELLISITDNGKGLATTAKESSDHVSRASQIIKDRIYLLNMKLRTKATFSIDNNTNGKGVTVLVKLPLLYKQDLKA